MPQHVKGSGVIADADHGLVVTAYHLVERSERVTVTLFGGREVTARVLAASPGDLPCLGSSRPVFTEIGLDQADDLQVDALPHSAVARSSRALGGVGGHGVISYSAIGTTGRLPSRGLCGGHR